MAGIGFQLRRLARRDTISSLVASAGHAAVIAAGPWLFTIFSLLTITILTERIAGLETLATFRVIIIYAFAVSLVLSAPVVIVATRLVSDALWARRAGEVPGLMLAAYLAAVAAAGAGAAVLMIVFPLTPGIAAALAANSMLVALIWVALAFCGAVRDYRGVTGSFAVGLLVALVASIGAALAGLGAPGMATGFLIGLTTTWIGLTGRVLATFPAAVKAPWAGLPKLVGAMRSHSPLAAGALAGTLGVWIDKWVFWASAGGERVEGGLMHAPLYDSAMFIASLVIIPALASFVVRLETGFFDRYQQYYATIQGHGTLGQIEGTRRALNDYTLENLTLITIAQAGLCAVLILTAPLIIDLLNMQFRQIAMLRYGALGAAFHFVFIAATSLLLFFDRRQHYLALQCLFLALNLSLAVLSLRLGEDFHGVGYFLACLLSSAVAFVAADLTFRRLNYLTFIGNNPSIEASSTTRRGRWWQRNPANPDGGR